jgi:hypothetical protein
MCYGLTGDILYTLYKFPTLTTSLTPSFNLQSREHLRQDPQDPGKWLLVKLLVNSSRHLGKPDNKNTPRVAN